MQNGCDTRWIHPKLINWPNPGYDDPNAGLPILNWSSSTASDVTITIEKEWEELVDRLCGGAGRPPRMLSVYLGVTFLRVSVVPKKLRGRPRQRNSISVEWISDDRVERRKIKGDSVSPSGTEFFDHLVFATGFGLETNSRDSYWRNESLGQIGLDGIQRRFLVSGFGDGAIIDIMRLTIKNFRPDRILSDVKFVNLEKIIINRKWSSFVNEFDSILSSNKSEASREIHNLIKYFKQRQRDDTYVVLHCLGSNGFRKALDDSPAALINKFFVYALYKMGGFQYAESDRPDDESNVAVRYAVPPENIIRRYGADRKAVLNELLPDLKSTSVLKTGKVGRPKKVNSALSAALKLQSVDKCETVVAVCQLCVLMRKLILLK